MCSRASILTISFFIAISVSTVTRAGDIEGSIELEASRKLGTVSVTNAVVFYRPEATIEAEYLPQGTPTSATMTMAMKAFDPTVISVNAGTDVHFPNADRVIHNAFSTTKNNKFDLGFYPQGETRTWTFDEPGLVKVFCNVHQGMVGYVMVMDTPYHTQPAADGSFRFDNVQPGVGTLFVWHPRGKTFTKVVEVGAEGEVTEVSAALKLTKRLVPKHKNKFGRSYKRSRDY